MKVQKQTVKKRVYFLFSLIGFLFFFFSFTGGQLAQEGNIVWTTRYFLILMCICIILGSIMGLSICKIIVTVGKKMEGYVYQEPSILKPLNGRKCFLISWILFILSWLPGFLAYYPAICAYDTPAQMKQLTRGWFNTHHPLAHTAILKMFHSLGKNVLGSANDGIALFAFMQVLFLGATFALGIALLRIKGVKWRWLLGLLMYGMFFPFHMYMSICITKDILFTIFILIQFYSLYKILSNMHDEIKVDKWDLIFLLSTIGMILFRNNGRYAFLVLIVFGVLTVMFSKKRKFWSKILINSIVGFILGNLLLSGLSYILHSGQGDNREMLSMPIQQLARTMIYHGGVGVLPEDDNTMNDVDKAFIKDFILEEGYKRYKGDISDPVKANTNFDVFRYRFNDFTKTYLHLLEQYPGEFVNAVLVVNAGYLYPKDTSHAYIYAYKGYPGLGYIQTRWEDFSSIDGADIYKDSKWEWLHEKLEDNADSNKYLSVPILKYIFVPGSYLWLYLFFAAYLILRQKYRLLFPLALIIGYYITLFLGPTVQLRYIYPIMVTFPFIIAWGVSYEKNNESTKNVNSKTNI